MSKRKATATQDDELLVLKTNLISESTKKIIEIHDFIKKIEDEEKNQLKISSPMFKLAGGGVDFSIEVYPDYQGSGNINVRFRNHTIEDLLSSITVKASGAEGSIEMKKVPARMSLGCWFLSHEKYREWVKTHGDVLKLEVVVTLHSKARGDGWTR